MFEKVLLCTEEGLTEGHTVADPTVAPTGAGTEGDPMVFVRVSETYDLSTKVGKMGVVGIHTPKSELIHKMYRGLAMNHKYARFVECDVTLACASMLPADPLQIGLAAGDIAPQDMFNPILYRAVSNDSMSNMMAWLESWQTSVADSVVNKGSIVDVNDPGFAFNDDVPINQFDMYYGLLADADGWRKAMPQAGLTMKGLYPIVFSVSSSSGMNTSLGGLSTTDFGPASKDSVVKSIDARFMRGPAMRMPRFNTAFWDTDPIQGSTVLDGNACSTIGDADVLPTCYVAMIVLPPAKLNQLYYRLKVTWTLEFSEVRPISDIGTWRLMSEVGNTAYGTDYNTQSKTMSSVNCMVDTDGADITKVMEGA